MSDTNSIWPNGMGVDENGYAVFYPIGTNKVEIPKNSPHWPKGNKLIGQFVYKDDKLVGFCDTKAMTATSGDIIVMPYETIDTEFDSIEKDSIQIHAPKAVVKKASWADGVKEDIADVNYKYKGRKNVNDIKTIDANFLENDIVDGKWTELLSELDYGLNMFYGCENLTSFISDLSSLTDGQTMFKGCSNLTTFESDLSCIENGMGMFSKCSNISTFDIDLESLTKGDFMFSDCSNITTFKSSLKSLTTAPHMFNGCPNLSIFECEDLSSLTDASYMFQGSMIEKIDCDLKSLKSGISMFLNCSNLTSFSSNLSSLTDGRYMFSYCSNLESFTSDLSSLIDGSLMFKTCSNLISFNADLSSLTDGQYMFKECSNISTFDNDLKSLTNGQSMFMKCSNLVSFNSVLSSLTNGYQMFYECSGLTSFDSDLNSLTKCGQMFYNCQNLRTFKSNLSSLTDGANMFHYCKLDATSIKNIIDTINTVESANLTLGIGCDNNVTDKDLFAQEVRYPNMSTLLQTLQNKGWTVSAQYNGRPSSNYSLRQPQSLPVFVKLVEVVLPVNEEEISPIYEYTSQDNTKFYNLDWFHETTGSTDTYTQFSSLEEAITHFNIKPIEK